MTDIVERLRALAHDYHQHRPYYSEAADEIMRLRAEIETWKERWKSEYEDHETTIKHMNRMENEPNGG